jgi:AraC-like DNA-binding protein
MREEIADFYLNQEEYPFNLQMAGISYCDGSYHIERTNPDIYVFEYILEGEGTILVEGEAFRPVKGDVYMLHRGKNHRYFSDDRQPWTKIWVNIYGKLIESLIQAYGLSQVYLIPKLDLSELFFKMIELTKDTGLQTKELFEREALLFHEMIIRIANRISESNTLPITPAQRLRQYIDQNAEKSLSMKELSGVIYKSPSQTVRLFKNEFHITPYEYLLNQKLEMAKLLLLNSGIQVKEIAYRLNFADEHYFSNCFKAKTGVSPSGFRTQY